MHVRQKNKISKDEVEYQVDAICILNWDIEYRVVFDSDDMGNHISVLFEGKVPHESKDLLQSPFQGWRLVRIMVPEGYLAAFYPLGKL
tara:strand:- start:243 stop:506 length:264 start_codon:yes stop_codon:yes gene_type:complete